MGCVIAPATFLLFYKAFPVGVPGTAYPAPYATIYRAMAVLGVEVRPSSPSPCSVQLVSWSKLPSCWGAQMPAIGRVCHQHDATGVIDGLCRSQARSFSTKLLVQGISALPKHCTQMCIGFFFGALAFSVLRDLLPKKYGAYVPIPMAAAIPFYIGAQLAVSSFPSTLQNT